MTNDADRRSPRARPPRSRLRRLLRVLSFAAALVAVLFVVVLAAWRSGWLERALLSAADRTLQEKLGTGMSAERLIVRGFGRSLTLEGLLLGDPARPFLTAEHVEARLDVRSLLTDRPTVEHLRVEGVHVDLGARWPRPPDAEDGAAKGEPSSTRLVVERFAVRDGTVARDALDPAFDVWADRWRLGDVAIDGAFDGERFEVARLSGTAHVESHRREPIAATFAAAMAGRLDGPFSVRELSVTGPGLRLAGTASGALTAGLPFDLRLETHVDAARTFPDLSPRGTLDATVVLAHDARAPGGGPWDVSLELDARSFPAELADPLLAGLGLESLQLAGSRLSARASLRGVADTTGTPFRVEQLDGRVDAEWRNDDARLLVAHVTAGGAKAARLEVAVDLWPDAPGVRRASGTVSAREWTWPPEDGRIVAQCELALPGLDDPRWYMGLDRDLGWKPLGDLLATAAIDGPLDAPRVDADLRWNVEGTTIVRAAARSVVGTRPFALRATAVLLPDEPGERSMRGTWTATDARRFATGVLDDARVELNVPDLRATAERVTTLADRLLAPELAARGHAWADTAAAGLRGSLNATATARGPLRALQFDLEALWRPDATARVRVQGAGAVTPDRPYGLRDVELTVDFDALSTGPLVAAVNAALPVSGVVSGRVHLERLPEAIAGTLRLDGRDVRIGETLRFPSVDVAAHTDGEVLELTRLTVTLPQPVALPGAAPAPGGGGPKPTLTARGTVPLERPLARAELRVEATRPVVGIDRAAITLGLADGALTVETTELRYADGESHLVARVPLGAWVTVSERLAPATILTADGAVELSVDGLEIAPLLSLFGVQSPFDAVVDGDLVVDPADLLAARGELRVGALRADVGDERLFAERELRFAFDAGRVTLEPTEIVWVSDRLGHTLPLQIAAVGRLAGDWRPGDDPANLVEHVDARLDGTVEAALIAPFVPGLRATGRVDVEVDVAGPPLAPNLTARLTGPAARLLWAGTYPLTLEAPDVRFSMRDGQPRLDYARGRLNGGRLEATGEQDGETLHVQADVSGARLRLDFGITAEIDADLALLWPPTGLRTLSGRIVVDRAVLHRDVNLEREALRVLFEPATGTGAEQLDLLALDLTVDTREGVFIDNNIADLHADWSGLRVTGTAAAPRLSGHVDVAPGGWLSAFGTVYRIDELTLSWLDEPPSAARVVLETTSSIDDPSLLQQYRGLAFAGVGSRGPGEGGQLDFRGAQPGGSDAEGVTAAIASYYQDKLAGAVSTANTQFSFEPVPLFGETDTQARYTLWQLVNPNTSLIWSVDPRQSEAQTWILDLHGFRFAPRWRMQVFTRDAGLVGDEAGSTAGATIQQTLELGGGRPRDDPRPTLAEVDVTVDGRLAARRVKAVTGYRKGDPFAPGAVLDVEVDVVDLLRRRGFPAGAVDVDVTPLDGDRVELAIDVVTGERVAFAFAGERLPRAARREIRSLYRPEERDRRAALAAMQAEAVKWLRAKGYLFPEVAVDFVPPDPARPDDPTTVRVAMEGGRRVDPGAPTFQGVPDADARALAASFASTLERVRLAAGTPETDSFLLHSMRAIGYPDARIVGRELSEDGERLTVDVAPGPRQRIVEIAVDGVGAGVAERLAGLARLGAGDPPRFAAISASSRAMEDELAARGHAEARVRAVVTPRDAERPLEMLLRFEVSPGPIYRIADVRFDGLRGANRRWVARNADLEPGSLLRREEIAAARRTLYRTGVFQRIQVEGDRPRLETDDAEPPVAACGPLCPSEPGVAEAPVRETEIVFEMQEKRRYQLSYGLRWESDAGLGLVVDAVDRNSLGRGHTTGARAIFGDDLKSLRFYHQIPRIVRHRSSLEFFVEGSEERLDAATKAETVQFWTQFTTPLGPRTQTRLYAVLENRKLVAGDRRPLDERVVSPRLGWQWIYTNVDRALGRDRKGWFVGLDVSGSHEALGSDLTSVAAFEHFKLFLPFRKERYNWAQSWRIGLVDSRDQTVPTADRLRAGGSYSVRGYSTNSLGPRGPDGTALGGEVQLIVNQELHRVIAGPVGGLLFFDVGNVWESLDTVDSELFKSVGLGVRYLSPIGPLRLDVAWPLDRRPEDSTYQIYLGFGQVF